MLKLDTDGDVKDSGDPAPNDEGVCHFVDAGLDDSGTTEKEQGVEVSASLYSATVDDYTSSSNTSLSPDERCEKSP